MPKRITKSRVRKKNVQPFHGTGPKGKKRLKMLLKGKIVAGRPSIEAVEINGKTFIKKTPSRIFLGSSQPDLARNPRAAESMTRGEVILIKELLKTHNKLSEQGVFTPDYSLRGLKIFRVNVDRKSAEGNYFLMEYLERPNVNQLVNFILKEDSGAGLNADHLCLNFIETNGLAGYLGSKISRSNLARQINLAADKVIENLKKSKEKFDQNSHRRGFKPVLDSDLARYNLLVDSFKTGEKSFVLTDPLEPHTFESFLPENRRVTKRNKRAEVEAKGRTYSTAGIPKRRKKKN